MPMVEVQIAGQTLRISGEADSDHMLRIADYLNQKLAPLLAGNARPLQQALLLASLDVIDELFRLRQKRSRERMLMKSEIDQILAMLENQLTGNPPPPPPAARREEPELPDDPPDHEGGLT